MSVGDKCKRSLHRNPSNRHENVTPDSRDLADFHNNPFKIALYYTLLSMSDI